MSTPPRSISVLLADHHLLMRHGLRRILEDQGDIAIVGETRDTQETLALVQRLSPDVLVIDLALPHLGGVPTIRLARQVASGMEIVAVSTEAGEQAMDALEAGASGYVPADTDPETLLRVIRGVAAGGLVMAARPFPPGARAGARRQVKARISRAGLDGLSTREAEILGEVAQGATDREIATKLKISEATVKTHIRSILKKGRARNRAHAVARFLLDAVTDESRDQRRMLDR